MKTPAGTLQADRLGALPGRGLFPPVCAFRCGSIDYFSPRAAVKLLDRLLRAFLGIHEFTEDPRCILRYSRTSSKSAMILPNGEPLKHGDPIVELHFWNDRLGPYFEQGWSRTSLRSALRNSLALLACRIRSDQSFSDVKAVHGTLARATGRSCSIHRPFNCPMHVAQRPAKSGIHDFLEDFLVHMLHWAFNPSGSRTRSLRMNRVEVWISVADIEKRFDDAALAGESRSAIGTDAPRQLTVDVHRKLEAIGIAGD